MSENLLLEQGLAPEATVLLQPETTLPDGNPAPSLMAHGLRVDRLEKVPGFRTLQDMVLERRGDSGPELRFVNPTDIRDTYARTQFPGENHRRLVPVMQEIIADPDTRRFFFDGMDEASARSTERLLEKAERNGGVLEYDIAVIGSGPHGAATAMRLCEQFPSLRILMIDQNRLGGLWRSNGDDASYFMNSRVREPNRKLAPLPRTPGNINPLGPYAVLELADIVPGDYASNIQMGDVVAVDDFLSVDDVLIGTCNGLITDYGDRATTRVEAGDRSVLISAGAIVDATGIYQESTLVTPEFSSVKDAPWYFDVSGVYRKFGNYENRLNYNPLKDFNGKDVIVVGAGDSALTALEALIGKMQQKEYGSKRYGPSRIYWVGAPGRFAADIDRCLRSRYKNGIIQALPKSEDDEGAIIVPIMARAERLADVGNAPALRLSDGSGLRGDVLFDCTNTKRADAYGPRVLSLRTKTKQQAVFRVGPSANEQLPDSIIEDIRRLGIGENTVALWALMGLTNQKAYSAGLAALNTKVRRAQAVSRPKFDAV